MAKNKAEGINIEQMMKLLIKLRDEKKATHFDIEIDEGRVYIYPLKYTSDEDSPKEELDKPNQLFSDDI
jgi:hypothetical protein